MHDLRRAHEHRERTARRVDERPLPGAHDEAARRGAHLGERERARGRSSRRGDCDHQEQYERRQEARHRARVACSLATSAGRGRLEGRARPASHRFRASVGSGGGARAGRGTLPSVDARTPFLPRWQAHRCARIPPKRGSVAASRAAGYPPLMVSTARVRAPELDGAGGFIGTAGPLTLASLRGRVVLLDFWTQACINCLHVLEEIQRARAAVRRRPARDRDPLAEVPARAQPRGRRARGRAPRDRRTPCWTTPTGGPGRPTPFRPGRRSC